MVNSLASTVSIIYDETDYWKPLCTDIRKAQGALVVHCPFISKRGLERLIPEIEAAIKRGVIVTVVLRQPRERGKVVQERQTDREIADIGTTESLVKWLRSVGAHVELRERIHEKFVLIDEHILWEGSLNYLSHFDTTEHLRRSINNKELREVRDRHNLNDIPSYGNGTGWISQVRRRLVERRKQCGFSQGAMADRVSIDPSEMSKLENGQRKLFNGPFTKMLEILDMRIVLVPTYLAGQVEAYVERAISKSSK